MNPGYFQQYYSRAIVLTEMDCRSEAIRALEDFLKSCTLKPIKLNLHEDSYLYHRSFFISTYCRGTVIN